MSVLKFDVLAFESNLEEILRHVESEEELKRVKTTLEDSIELFYAEKFSQLKNSKEREAYN